jgi:hypothetical protein
MHFFLLGNLGIENGLVESFAPCRWTYFSILHQRTIEVLKSDADKIRCVLNKADQIDRQRLMKVCVLTPSPHPPTPAVFLGIIRKNGFPFWGQVRSFDVVYGEGITNT